MQVGEHSPCENKNANALRLQPSGEMKLLNKQFQTLHSVSSVLNMGALLTTGLIGWKIGSKGLGPKISGGLGVL